MPSNSNFSIADMILLFYNFTFSVMIVGVAVGGMFLKFHFPTPMLAIAVVFSWRYGYLLIHSTHYTLIRCNKDQPDSVVCQKSLFYGWLFIIIFGLIPRIIVYVFPENFDVLYLVFFACTRLIFYTHRSFCGNEKEFCKVEYDWNDPIPGALLLIQMIVHIRYFPKEVYWTVAFFQFYYIGITAAATVEAFQVLRGNIRMVKERPENL